MIRYTDATDSIEPSMLLGFFEGWATPPLPETHLHILKKSAHVVLAVDQVEDRVIGFINAVSDGVMSAYIPLLEVLPPYRRRGVGKELVTRMLAKIDHLYMVDICCDPDVQGFYEQFGMTRSGGMMIRNFDRQRGTGGSGSH